jgi:predicted ribosomally synthesized peptide with SipW-like signal peptide
MPAHLAVAAPASRLRRVARTVLVACITFAAAIAVAVAAAGGTFAYFSSTAPLNAGTLTSGTAGLTVENETSHGIGSLSSTLLPGVPARTASPLTVQNTGGANLRVEQGAEAVTGSATGIDAADFVVTVTQVAASATNCTGGTLANLRTSSVVLAAHQSMKVCVTIEIAPAASGLTSGATASFTIPLDGEQVAP